MNLEQVRDLINEKGSSEPNYETIESMVAGIFNNFTVDSTIAAFRIMYSYMIAFGYLDEDEAQEVFESIVLENSAFKLAEFARSIYTADMVQYYEDLIKVEYMTSLNPVVNQFDNMFEEMKDILEESEGSIEGLQDLLKEIED